MSLFWALHLLFHCLTEKYKRSLYLSFEISVNLLSSNAMALRMSRAVFDHTSSPADGVRALFDHVCSRSVFLCAWHVELNVQNTVFLWKTHVSHNESLSSCMCLSVSLSMTQIQCFPAGLQYPAVMLDCRSREHWWRLINY